MRAEQILDLPPMAACGELGRQAAQARCGSRGGAGRWQEDDDYDTMSQTDGPGLGVLVGRESRAMAHNESRHVYRASTCSTR